VVPPVRTFRFDQPDAYSAASLFRIDPLPTSRCAIAPRDAGLAPSRPHRHQRESASERAANLALADAARKHVANPAAVFVPRRPKRRTRAYGSPDTPRIGAYGRKARKRNRSMSRGEISMRKSCRISSCSRTPQILIAYAFQTICRSFAHLICTRAAILSVRAAPAAVNPPAGTCARPRSARRASASGRGRHRGFPLSARADRDAPFP